MEKIRGWEFPGLTVCHGEGPVTVPRSPELLLCPSAPGSWAADCDRIVRLWDIPTAGGLWPTHVVGAVCMHRPPSPRAYTWCTAGEAGRKLQVDPWATPVGHHTCGVEDAWRKRRVDFRCVPVMCAHSPYVPDVELRHSDPDTEASPRSGSGGRPQAPSSDSGVSLAAERGPT